MSIHDITIGEFSQLTLDEHEEALDLYDQAISDAAQGLAAYAVNPEEFAEGRDKLTRLITLRKVHAVRYQELQEAAAAPALASEEYLQNEPLAA